MEQTKILNINIHKNMTKDHVNRKLDEIFKMICDVGDVGGWYIGDDIQIEVKVTYKPEDK